MGQTAEVVGHLFGITRGQSDAYAAESHKRLANAQAQGWLARARSRQPSPVTGSSSITTTACGRTSTLEKLSTS